MDWGRSTCWNQGDCLPPELIDEVGIEVDRSASNLVVMLVSHDCDLAANPEREPFVEAIVGVEIESMQGDRTFAKHSRLLHLPLNIDKAERYFEFSASSKRSIKKSLLSNSRPNGSINLTQNAKQILQTWLANRYRRAALPDQFDEKLKSHKLDRKIVSILKPSQQHVRALLLKLEEHPQGDGAIKYAIDIFVVYATDEDAEKSESAAKDAAKRIFDAFEAKLFDANSGEWDTIQLDSCDEYADTAITFRESETLIRLNYDHLSLVESEE